MISLKKWNHNFEFFNDLSIHWINMLMNPVTVAAQLVISATNVQKIDHADEFNITGQLESVTNTQYLFSNKQTTLFLLN